MQPEGSEGPSSDVGAQESYCCALAGAGVSSDTAFGFADEMRVGLRGMVRRVWGRRGVKVHQVQMVLDVPVPGGRRSEGQALELSTR